VYVWPERDLTLGGRTRWVRPFFFRGRTVPRGPWTPRKGFGTSAIVRTLVTLDQRCAGFSPLAFFPSFFDPANMTVSSDSEFHSVILDSINDGVFTVDDQWCTP
jgi:hypothetical protein